MLKLSIKFLNQVKQEFKKISWTDKKQANSITLIVFLMIFITALYFFSLDWVLSTIVSFLLNLGS
jgi:preprotein translocase subunit SecE